MMVSKSYIDLTSFKIYHVKMDTLEDVDNITKNIVKEIIRECKIRGISTKFDEHFVLYFVQLLTLDPKWGISADTQIKRETISKFVNFSIDVLKNENCPFVRTIMSQHLFMSQPQIRKEKILQFRNLIEEKIMPLKQDILDYVLDDNRQKTKNLLLKKIIIFIILSSGLGNPKDNQTLTDVTNALGSVFDQKDILNFLEHNYDEKFAELTYIVDLVTGIRIFNEKTGKTSSGILEFHENLREVAKLSHAELQKVLVKIMERVNILTFIIEKSFHITVSESGLILEPSNFIQFDENYTSLLVAFRQQEIFIRNLLREVEDIKRNIVILIDDRFEEIVNRLIKIVKYKVAIPAVQVYPLFCELSKVESLIQDEAILLSTYNKILTKLVKFIREIPYDRDFFKKITKGYTILTDASRLEETNGQEIETDFVEMNSEILIIPIEDVDLKNIQLEYLGFCPWCLVQTNGGLIPGNPNMGIAKYQHKYYVFSCLEAAYAFCYNPDKYILQIMDLARVKCDLINFLQLHSSLSTVKDVPTLYKKPQVTTAILQNNVEIQTEVHPVESFIDKDYKWNVWDHYRDAIKMANLSKCATHATQTYKSHFRVPHRIQTLEYRSKLMQTNKDIHTNVPTLSNFLYGLRGQYFNGVPAHVVELTRAVKE